MRNNFNFLSSQFSRRDCFVGNPEDRFSRVVACVACSTALGQIFQVQQINILKTNIMRLVGFVALRPKSTAMVIAGRSVHLTTLFPGQA